MRRILTTLKAISSFVERHYNVIVFVIAIIIATLAVIHNYVNGTILAYGDAESHINIAKRVVSSITPGFGQLGGIWLPLHHLLMLPFVINDFMWRSGLGGAIASALCYVFSVFFVYKLAATLIKKPWAVVVATAIYAINPNVLYMLGTPMSELPLLAFMSGSLYFLVRWMYGDDVRILVLAALLSFGGVLIRYDAWYLLCMQVVAIVAMGLFRRYSRQKIAGTTLLFMFPSFLGVFLWMLWGIVVFHDPLYFLNSEYSAKSQQQAFLAKGELPTYHDLFQSTQYYMQAVIDNIGIILVALAAMGLIVMLVRSKKKELLRTLAVIVLLLSPLFFNVLSLFLGISILFIPELTPASFEFNLFNIRYGMMLVPAVAILVGYIISEVRPKVLNIVSSLAVGVVTLVFAFTMPITLKDGLEGLSARKSDRAATTIESDFIKIYDYGLVGIDDYGRAANPVDLQIPMSKIIYAGNHPYWDKLFKNPETVARYIIMQPDDKLWRALHNNKQFQNDYTLLSVRKFNVAGADSQAYLYKCTNNCTAKFR